MNQRPTTFYQFLMKQLERDDPVGDLALDVQRDKSAPKQSSDLNLWESHLWIKGACPEAVEALNEAFSEYKKLLII